MEEFEKRMVVEFQELTTKINKLGKFVYEVNTQEDKVDLRKELIESGEMFFMESQLNAMALYNNMLIMRMKIRGIYDKIIEEQMAAMGMNVDDIKDDTTNTETTKTEE